MTAEDAQGGVLVASSPEKDCVVVVSFELAFFGNGLGSPQ